MLYNSLIVLFMLVHCMLKVKLPKSEYFKLCSKFITEWNT